MGTVFFRSLLTVNSIKLVVLFFLNKGFLFLNNFMSVCPLAAARSSTGDSVVGTSLNLVLIKWCLWLVEIMWLVKLVQLVVGQVQESVCWLEVSLCKKCIST